MPDWSILQNALQSNPGEHFRQGMARGLMGGAMQGDGVSLNALMGVDPASAAAMQDRQSQLAARDEQTRARELSNRRNDIIMGASFLEGIDQVPPEQRPAFYMSAIQRAQAAGVNIDGAPPQYDEAYVGGLRQTAQALVRSTQRPQQPPQDPSSVREYEYAKQQGFQGSFMDFMETRRGPIVAANPDMPGTFTVIPRSMIQGGQTAQPGEVTATNPQTGERIRLNPQTGQWEPLQEGGSGSAAPGNFPGGGWW